MSTPPRFEQLKKFYWRNKRMPSVGELARLFRFKSKNAVRYWIEQWVEKELLQKDATGRLLPGRSFNPLKVLGTVQAGWPSPAEEEMADTISLDDWLIENKESSFMLKVSGDSMIDAGIHPGDIVILNRGRSPKHGDVVVAEIDHEWTIKFFERHGQSVTLRPANRRYKPLTPKEELRLAGVVTAVVRKYHG
jgi:SOS regulatory protein LexA